MLGIYTYIPNTNTKFCTKKNIKHSNDQFHVIPNRNSNHEKLIHKIDALKLQYMYGTNIEQNPIP